MNKSNIVKLRKHLYQLKFEFQLSFIIGLSWMSDSMEIMILSILSPALHCEWVCVKNYV